MWYTPIVSRCNVYTGRKGREGGKDIAFGPRRPDGRQSYTSRARPRHTSLGTSGRLVYVEEEDTNGGRRDDVLMSSEHSGGGRSARQ